MTVTDSAGDRRRSGAWLVAGGVAAVLMVAVAGASFTAAFSPAMTAVLVGVACVAGGLVGALMTTRSVPVVLRVVGAVLAAGVVLMAVGLRRIDPGGLVDGLIDGPRRLLTGGVPADDDELARIPPMVVCLVASAVAVVMARARRPLGLALAALVALVTGTATGLARDQPRWGVVTVFAGVLLVGLWSLTRREDTWSSARPVAPGLRPLAAGAMVVMSVAVGVVGARAIAGAGADDRATLRSLVDHDEERIQLVNPLDVAAELIENKENEPVGSVELSAPGLSRLPVATFETYDGDTFLFASEVQPVGTRVEGAASSSATVVQDLELEGWPFPTLPHIGRAIAVEAPASSTTTLGIDTISGRLVSVGERPQGRWSITSGLNGLHASQAPVDEQVARSLDDLPALPSSFDTIIEESRQQIEPLGRTFAAVDGLAARFRAQFAVIEVGAEPEDQRGGHGALALGCLVHEGFDAVDSCAKRIGSQTQVAAAFVLVTRSLGLPTRLVVGFGIDPNVVGPQAITPHAVDAWAEVAVEGVGWVEVDPVPEREGEVQPLDAAGDVEESGDSGAAEGGGEDPLEEDPSDDERSSIAAEERGRWALLAAPAALAGAVAAPGLLRRRRGRRRRRGSASQAAIGAWWEMNDRLRERGDPVEPGATVTDVVRRHNPDEDGSPVTRAVNAAAFGGQDVAPDLAAQAWVSVARGEEAWKGTATRRHRVRRYFRVARRSNPR